MININLFKSLTLEPEELPFNYDFCEPFVSLEAMRIHYENHYMSYINKTLLLLNNPEKKNINLLNLIKNNTKNNTIYNNSAQILNHHIYWLCIKEKINKDIIENKYNKKYDEFALDFVDIGTNHFGSGWIWVLCDENNLKIITTNNGHIPEEFLLGNMSLITMCDLWEHAYYIDYKFKKKIFLENFINRI